MNSYQWNAIEPILDKALELPKNKRRDFVKNSCRENSDLYDTIIKLLDAIDHSEQEHFLDKASNENSELIQNLASDNISSNFIGKRVGVFELTEQIGSGGMSAVFKAERADGQFNQQVAIKLIRSGLHSEEILKRFELEKQILANLTHPNIARLYDGGITNDGNPYLIMELIAGMPIDQYCNHHKLSITERLHLFEDICKAVEYAHSNLIVHRDLKAENIFVTGNGQVKILDFGIAKLLDTKLTNKQLIETLPDQHFWTPQYASPEQIEGKNITTASDVYSLGVLLHKILVEAYPYDFEGKSITQIHDVIKSKKPDTLIKALQAYSNSEVGKIAEQRNTTIHTLKKVMNGDLKAITSNALCRNINDRYASVGKLSKDIDNYQHKLPISAHKQTFVYRFKHFFRRYKKGVSVAAVIVAIITSLTVYYTHQLSKRKQAAIYEAKKATTVSTLLKNILRKSSPYGRYKKNVSLAQLLTVGKQQIKNKLQGQPLLKAEMLGLLGEIYTNLGRYTEAKPLLNRALRIQKNTKKTDIKLQALNLNRLGYLLFRQGFFDSSKRKYRKAEFILRKSDGNNRLLLASLYNNMGMVYDESGKKKKAILFYKHAFKLVPKKHKMQKASILGNLGILYQNLGKFEKSRRLLEKNLSIMEKLSDYPTPSLANVYNNLAFTYQRAGNLLKADSLHRIALSMRKKLLPPNHPHIASSLVRFGLLKIKQGRLVEAEQMLKRAYEILSLRLPDDHWQVLSAKGGLALTRGLQGELKTSIPILKNIYKRYNKLFGRSDWRTKTVSKALQTLLLAKKQTTSNFKN